MVDIVQDYAKTVPPHVWMPPVHTQHKESMLCQTKGHPYFPMNLMPLYVWMPPYVWMLLYA